MGKITNDWFRKSTGGGREKQLLSLLKTGWFLTLVDVGTHPRKAGANTETSGKKKEEEKETVANSKSQGSSIHSLLDNTSINYI